MKRRVEFVKQFDGCRTAKEIASFYFGYYSYMPSRMEAFRRAIMETPGMYVRMKSKGYVDNGEFLSPAQIAIIVELWGLPNEVARLLKDLDSAE